MRTAFFAGPCSSAWPRRRPPRSRPSSRTPGRNPPAPEPTPVVRLAVKPGRPEDRALKYTLLPDPLDLTPGNAAPLWIAPATPPSNVSTSSPDEGSVAQVARRSTPRREMPLKDLAEGGNPRLPRPLHHGPPPGRPGRPLRPLRLGIAALYDAGLRLPAGRNPAPAHDRGPARPALPAGAEREAGSTTPIRTLQTGFALARDVGKGDTLIQDLVAIAIGVHHVRPRRGVDADPRLAEPLLGAHRPARPAGQHRPRHAHRTDHALPLLPAAAGGAAQFRQGGAERGGSEPDHRRAVQGLGDASSARTCRNGRGSSAPPPSS